MTDSYTFAAVSYSNAAPLAHFLPEADPRVKVIYDRPSQLADRLADRSADAALVPVVDYFANPDLEMIDGLGICADGDVRSVLLKCNRPLAEIQTVALDPASKTSNALGRVLLAEHFGLSVQARYGRPGEQADGEVVIGDRALSCIAGAGGNYDLAGQWKAMTSLPFVFAVWAYRRDHPDPQRLRAIATTARDVGLQRIDELAALHSARLDLPVDECRGYLTSSVRYDVADRELEAMTLFRQFWQELEGDQP